MITKIRLKSIAWQIAALFTTFAFCYVCTFIILGYSHLMAVFASTILARFLKFYSLKKMPDDEYYIEEGMAVVHCYAYILSIGAFGYFVLIYGLGEFLLTGFNRAEG